MAINKLRRDVLFSLMLVAIPLNSILWYVNSEVIPFSIAWEAIASIRFVDSEWKENLQDEEADFDRWARSKHISMSETETRKRSLWRSWPAVLSGLIASGVVAFVTLGSAFFFALRELSNSVEYRAQQYRMQDYGRVEMGISHG